MRPKPYRSATVKVTPAQSKILVRMLHLPEDEADSPSDGAQGQTFRALWRKGFVTEFSVEYRLYKLTDKGRSVAEREARGEVAE